MQHELTVHLVAWSQAWADLRAVRSAVFIVEQGVPEHEEWDEFDALSLHVLARDAAQRPIGTGRLLPDGHLGRMAVLKAWRGRGVGAAILASLIEAARERGLARLILHAQTHALGFYEKFGFRVYGEAFAEVGIAHRAMCLDL